MNFNTQSTVTANYFLLMLSAMKTQAKNGIIEVSSVSVIDTIIQSVREKESEV